MSNQRRIMLSAHAQHYAGRSTIDPHSFKSEVRKHKFPIVLSHYCYAKTVDGEIKGYPKIRDIPKSATKIPNSIIRKLVELGGLDITDV